MGGLLALKELEQDAHRLRLVQIAIAGEGQANQIREMERKAKGG